MQILPRIGIGMNIFKPSLGHECNFHTGVTILYGNRRHFAETGTGIIHYFLQQYHFRTETDHTIWKPVYYGLAGYRFGFTKKPLALKIAITPIFIPNSDNWIIFPLAEIGIAYRI